MCLLCLLSVIFAADVKITFNEFRSSMVASTSSKTLVTVDPGECYINIQHCCISVVCLRSVLDPMCVLYQQCCTHVTTVCFDGLAHIMSVASVSDFGAQ